MAGLDTEITLLYKNRTYSPASMGMRALQDDFEAAAKRISPMLREELVLHLQTVVAKVIARNSTNRRRRFDFRGVLSEHS
jgi:hypothetical protein